MHLGKFALLVNQRDDVHWFDGDHVQGVLVVGELDVLPVDVLQVVLLLLQLEDVADEELLQVLVCKVDAQLLETGGRGGGGGGNGGFKWFEEDGGGKRQIWDHH